MKKIVNFLLKPLGLEINPQGTQWERDAFLKLYRDRSSYVRECSDSQTECIIFSKDRPMQIHALIGSYYEKVSSPAPVHVLYQTSENSCEDAYKEIKGTFSDKSINFARQRSEESFREDLINLLASLKSYKVFFLVDDIVFVEDLEMDDFTGFDTDKYVPSLRLGHNISLFYHFNVNQPHPQFITTNQDDKTKLFWRWEQGVYDWGYPLSLDGHLFSTDELLSIMQLIPFKAPNSLEAGLQKFAKLFGQRLGVCYQKSRIINIPCNKVQRENKNIFGSVDQHFLLRKWQEGFQMDYRKIYGFVNQSPQQEIEFQLIPRST